jgi:hypothetical protein
VQTLEELRCQANTLYINGIKNNKLSLSLIEYLYREISRVENLEMLQKMHVMTKLTLFIEAYKLGNVASLLDGSVFAQFKSHLRQEDDDGEQTEDGDLDNLEDEDNEDALNEIENELNDDDEDSGEGAQTYALGQDNGDGEGEASEGSSGSGSARPSASDESDGEWEDEDEEEEE